MVQTVPIADKRFRHGKQTGGNFADFSRNFQSVIFFRIFNVLCYVSMMERRLNVKRVSILN